jgi:endo-1,4-beta-xylanase
MEKVPNVLFAGMIALSGMVAQAQPTVPPHAPVPLWANGAPGSEGKTAPETVTVDAEGEHRVATVNNPSITPYLVRGAKTPTSAIIIAPGGGHQWLSIDMEGYDVAKYLSGHGVAAFVLKYRLAKEKGSTYTIEKDEIGDMQRAIRLVKSRAAEWNIDPERVGVMGFSAGGQLALMAAQEYHTGTANNDSTHLTPPAKLAAAPNRGETAPDAVDQQSNRPAFEVLMYPGGLTPEVIGKVTKDMPPGFLLCGADDRDTIAQMLPQLFVAMRKAGVSAELHEYAGVGHGFGLRLSQHGGVSDWPNLLVQWMDTKGFLRK